MLNSSFWMASYKGGQVFMGRDGFSLYDTGILKL